MREKQEDRDEQAPLGAHPSYDDLVDTAVEYTFPCSDPISIETCCASADAARAPAAADAQPPGSVIDQAAPPVPAGVPGARPEPDVGTGADAYPDGPNVEASPWELDAARGKLPER